MRILVMVMVLATIGALSAHGTPEQPIVKQDSGAKAKESGTEDNEQRSPVTVIVKQDNAAPSKPPMPKSDEDLDIQKQIVKYTGYLVIVGLITAGFICWQSLETRKAAQAAKQAALVASDTAEKQLRAYVCVDSACVKFPQPGVPEAQVHIKNWGQTPAYDFKGWIHTWFGPYPLNEALPSPSDDLIKGVETLPPGRKSIYVAAQKPPLPAELIASLGTPQFTMYVYGEIRYRDIYKKEQRWTRFRLLYGGPREPRKIPNKEEWFLMPDITGNETS